MSRMIQRRDENPGTFDDFATQYRWYRDGLAKACAETVLRLFAAKGGKAWNLIQRLDDKDIGSDWSTCSGGSVKWPAILQSLR